MNLERNPTREQLAALLARYDDSAGHHVLWVSRTGDVEISRLPAGMSPVTFEQAHPEIQVRYEAFLAGNGYVGAGAARDAGWVAALVESLMREWAAAKGQPGVAYVDLVSLEPLPELD